MRFGMEFKGTRSPPCPEADGASEDAELFAALDCHRVRACLGLRVGACLGLWGKGMGLV